MASSKRSKRTSTTSANALRPDTPSRLHEATQLRETALDGYTVLVDVETSRRMAGVRRHGTTPELVVRKVVSSLGHRYRVSNPDLPGSPDLANRSRRWAIFVHGCYWHRHRGCKLATTPKRNRDFWVAKFERNVARDSQALDDLGGGLGFSVLVVWECETRDVVKLSRRLASWQGFRADGKRRKTSA